MGRFISQALDRVLDYLLIPVGNWLIAFLPMVWWLSAWPGDVMNRFIPALVTMLTILAVVYEMGYKKFYLHDRRQYFYWIFVPPAAAATVGFTYGIYLW